MNILKKLRRPWCKHPYWVAIGYNPDTLQVDYDITFICTKCLKAVPSSALGAMMAHFSAWQGKFFEVDKSGLPVLRLEDVEPYLGTGK